MARHWLCELELERTERQELWALKKCHCWNCVKLTKAGRICRHQNKKKKKKDDSLRTREIIYIGGSHLGQQMNRKQCKIVHVYELFKRVENFQQILNMDQDLSIKNKICHIQMYIYIYIKKECTMYQVL